MLCLEEIKFVKRGKWNACTVAIIYMTVALFTDMFFVYNINKPYYKYKHCEKTYKFNFMKIYQQHLVFRHGNY